MKPHTHTLFLFLALAVRAIAQVPQGIPYQAVARDAQGQPLASRAVKVRFSVLDSILTGNAVYVETHTTTTSSLGLFSVNIGMGTPVTGTFSGINWGVNSKFLKVELDTTASGNNYVNLGTQQMMSVPYALYSESSKSISNGISFSNYQVYKTPGNYTWQKPIGVNKVMVECWGAGSGGSNFTSPCAGSSGGYGKSLIDLSNVNFVSIVIGRGSNPNLNSHLAGGNSSFGNYIVSTGAGAGPCGSSLPGTSNGNIISITGGRNYSVPSTSNLFIKGGDAPYGGFGGNSYSISTVDGGNPGAGAAYLFDSSNNKYGKGGDGMVIIYW